MKMGTLVNQEKDDSENVSGRRKKRGTWQGKEGKGKREEKEKGREGIKYRLKV